MRTNSEQTERILELKNEYLRKQAIRKKYLMLVLPSVALIAIIFSITVATAFGSSKAGNKAPADAAAVQEVSNNNKSHQAQDGNIIDKSEAEFYNSSNKSNESYYSREDSVDISVPEIGYSTTNIVSTSEYSGIVATNSTTTVATTLATTLPETLQPSVTPEETRSVEETIGGELVETTFVQPETFATEEDTEGPDIIETTSNDKELSASTNYYDGFRSLSFNYKDRFYSNACYAYTTSVLKEELIDKQYFESPEEKKIGCIYSINNISSGAILLLCFEDGEYEESYLLYSYNGEVPFYTLCSDLSLKELMSRAAKMEGNIEISDFKKMFEYGYEPKEDFSSDSFTTEVGNIRILSGAKSGFHTTFALNATVYTNEKKDIYYCKIVLSSLDGSMYFATSSFLYNS